MLKSRLMLGDRIQLTDEETARVVHHLGGDGSDLVITDMMERKNYNRPDAIGVKRDGAGLALGVPVAAVIITAR